MVLLVNIESLLGHLAVVQEDVDDYFVSRVAITEKHHSMEARIAVLALHVDIGTDFD